MRLPRAVGIIPDGNRRWARSRGVSLGYAYMVGVKKAIDVADFLLERGVERVFFYLLSEENCVKRESEELQLIGEIVKSNLSEAEIVARRHDAQIVTIGNLPLLPESLRETAERYSLLRILEEGDGRVEERLIVVGTCYSVMWELKASPCTPITTLLGEIDLVIRSGGERRLSGFFPLLTLYSELYFIDKYWPEIGFEDLEEALKWYSTRERRMGA